MASSVGTFSVLNLMGIKRRLIDNGKNKFLLLTKFLKMFRFLRIGRYSLQIVIM
jgi:hypothetical protein